MVRALPWVGLAIRLGAAAIWLVAGTAKLVDLEHFRSQVGAYDILPSSLVAPFAYGLPFLEAGIGLYLALGLFVRPVALLACGLMIVFIAAQAQAWARGLSLSCGCFGALAQEHVGLWAILRDVALGLPTVVLAIWPARLYSADRKLFGLPDAFSVPKPT